MQSDFNGSITRIGGGRQRRHGRSNFDAKGEGAKERGSVERESPRE